MSRSVPSGHASAALAEPTDVRALVALAFGIGFLATALVGIAATLL